MTSSKRRSGEEGGDKIRETRSQRERQIVERRVLWECEWLKRGARLEKLAEKEGVRKLRGLGNLGDHAGVKESINFGLSKAKKRKMIGFGT